MPDNLEPITQTPTISPTQPEPEAITPQSQLPPAEPNPIPSQANSASDTFDTLPPKPTSNRPLLLWIVLIALLAGGIGGYFLRSPKFNDKLNPESTIRVQDPETEQATEIDTNAEEESDPTADWETYFNSKYNYTFKYPPLMEIDRESSVGDPNASDEVISASKQVNLHYPQKGTILLIAEFGRYDEETRKEIPIECYTKITDPECVSKLTVDEFKPITVAGIPAILANKGGWERIFLLLDTKIFYIEVSSYDEESLKEIIQIRDKILSTFKFADSHTEAATNGCPAGMKFETNEFFNICLPQSMNPQQHVSQSKASSRYTDGNHVIQLTRHFEGGWGGLFCATSEKTKVSGYEASRTLNREGTEPSDCGSTIADIWTVITIPGGDTESYFLLEMKQVPDNTSIKPLDLLEYKRIEQSLEIK